jgi:hypothetical protein
MVNTCRFDQLKLTQAFLFESLDKICFDMLYFDSLFDVTQKQNLRQATHYQDQQRNCLPPPSPQKEGDSKTMIRRYRKTPKNSIYGSVCVSDEGSCRMLTGRVLSTFDYLVCVTQCRTFPHPLIPPYYLKASLK